MALGRFWKWGKGGLYNFCDYNCHRAMCMCGENPKSKNGSSSNCPLWRAKEEGGLHLFIAYHNHKEICACAHTHLHTVVSWVMWLGNVKYVIIVPERNSICNFSVVLLRGRMLFQPALNSQKNVWLYIYHFHQMLAFFHISPITLIVQLCSDVCFIWRY